MGEGVLICFVSFTRSPGGSIGNQQGVSTEFTVTPDLAGACGLLILAKRLFQSETPAIAQLVARAVRMRWRAFEFALLYYATAEVTMGSQSSGPFCSTL